MIKQIKIQQWDIKIEKINLIKTEYAVLKEIANDSKTLENRGVTCEGVGRHEPTQTTAQPARAPCVPSRLLTLNVVPFLVFKSPTISKTTHIII